MAIAAIAATDNTLLLAAGLGLALLVGRLAKRTALLCQAMRASSVVAMAVFVLSFAGAGREAALEAVLRLLAIVAWSVIVLASMTANELGGALVAGGLPFPAAFVVTAALQFVPVIARRASAVRDAQRARGIPIDTPLGSLRHGPALLVPLLYQAFKLADELAEALEMRGLSRPGRTQVRSYRLTRLDWLLLALCGTATAWYVAVSGQ